MENEDLLLRQMPHSLKGEQAVLGSILIDPDCVNKVMGKLRPEDFYLKQNREIFETILSMFTNARHIDGITVCEEMQQNGVYDEQTTRSYLAQLMDITPTSQNVEDYVEIVRNRALSRRPGRSPPWPGRGWEAPGTSWRLQSRKFSPSAGARGLSRWSG